MSILLAILKVIGIILLVVIGIVVLIILLILFVPMCYRIKADHNEEHTEVDFSVRYLLASGKGSFIKGEGLKYKVKFLFFTLADSENKAEEDDAGDGIDVMDLDPNEDFFTADTPAAENAEGEVPAVENADVQVPTIEDAQGEVTVVESVPGETVENPPAVPEPLSGEVEGEFEDTFVDTSTMSKKELKKYLKEEKKRRKEEKKRAKAEKKAKKQEEGNFLDKIDEKLDKIASKKEKFSKKADHIDQFLDKPFVQKTLKRGFKIIKRLFGTIKPKKSKGYLKLGLKSPASTGEMLARLGKFYPLYGRWLVIDPDFYHKVIEGNADIKGRVYLFRFVFPALRLLISRDFWRTYKLAKKI